MDISDIKFWGFNNFKQINEEKSLKWFAPVPFTRGESCKVKKPTLKLDFDGKSLTTTNNKRVSFAKTNAVASHQMAMDKIIEQEKKFHKLANPLPNSVQSMLDQYNTFGQKNDLLSMAKSMGVDTARNSLKDITSAFSSELQASIGLSNDYDSLSKRFGIDSPEDKLKDIANTISPVAQTSVGLSNDYDSLSKRLGLDSLEDRLKDISSAISPELQASIGLSNDYDTLSKRFGIDTQEYKLKDIANISSLGLQNDLQASLLKGILDMQFGGLDGLKNIAESSIASKAAVASFANISDYEQISLRDVTGLSASKTLSSVSKLSEAFGLGTLEDESLRLETLLGKVGGERDLFLSKTSAIQAALNDIHQFKGIDETLIDSGVIPSISDRKKVERSIIVDNDTLPPPIEISDYLPSKKDIKKSEDTKRLEKLIIELKDEVTTLQESEENPLVSSIAVSCLSKNPNTKRPIEFTPPKTIKADTVYYAVECAYHFELINKCFPSTKELWVFIKASIRSSEINISGVSTSITDENIVIIEGKNWDEENCQKFHKKHFE